MASLSTSLLTAVQSLGAATGALQVTNNNIANANTPGYSRQVAILQEAAPTVDGGISTGNGVVLEGFQSVRDELVQTQIQQETQAQSGANTAHIHHVDAGHWDGDVGPVLEYFRPRHRSGRHS